MCLTIASCGPVAPPHAVMKAAPDRALDDLLVLMRQRLELMHDVARYKWAKKVPIEDNARENALLEDVAARGRGLGLDPADTRAFFAAQVEAAKLVQRADFRRWQADSLGPQGEAPNLTEVLRPRIDALNRDLLDVFAKISRKERPGAVEIRSRALVLITGEGIDGEVRDVAIRPLLGAVR